MIRTWRGWTRITECYLKDVGRLRRVHSTVSRKRVLGAIAHINSGKTTTSEAMLYASGAVRRMGNVDVGDTLMDYLPAERERGITINAAAVCFDWKDHTFFLVDSPGHLDFTYEVERALKVMDGVVVLLDAVAGVQPQTETVWRQADANLLPRIVFVNKMDRDGADFVKTVEAVRGSFGAVPAVTQAAIYNRDGSFYGIFDLLQRFDDGTEPGHSSKSDDGNEASISQYDDLSSDQKRAVDQAVEKLKETVADVDDRVMESWVNDEAMSRDFIQSAIRRACIDGKLVPVLCGSSLKNVGVEALMDSVIHYLPSPAERQPVKAIRSSSGAEDDLHSQESSGVVNTPISETSPFLSYAFKVTHDKHRGRMVHLRAFSGGVKAGKTRFFNTTNGRMESPTRLVRVLADKYIEIDSIDAGDIFAAVGLKHTVTGDTIMLPDEGTGSEAVVLDGVKAPPAVFSVAVSVESATQERVLNEVLRRTEEEDCSLEIRTDEETGETLVSGMGELHLEVTMDRVASSLPFEIDVSPPRVAYQETICSEAEKTEQYDMTIGNTRLQASLHVRLEPATSGRVVTCSELGQAMPDGKGRESGNAAAAARDGAEAALGRGPILGAPVTNVRVHIRGTSESGGDENTVALRACAAQAVQKLLHECRCNVLEPVAEVTARVPTAQSGEVARELTHPTRRRGTIVLIESDTDGRMSRIKALVPMTGLLGWATRLRSLTHGRGELEMRFHGYHAAETAPGHSAGRRVLNDNM